MRLGRRFIIALGVVAGVASVALSLDHRFPFPFHRLQPPAATVVADRAGEPLRIFLPPDGILRLPARLDQISPEMRTALIASEDRYFHWHPGVNPLAVVRAAAVNLLAGRRVSGASTIPMQVARLAEPRPRTWRAKALEGLRALQLVWHLPRERILEAYLNLAPFGGNLEGVGAAAYSYFGKGPDELSLGEAALLTALPRSPSRYDPTRHPDRARVVRDRVLGQLVGRGVASASSAAAARRQPIPNRRRALPFLAPHLAERVRGQAVPGRTLHTSIDRGAQGKLERLVAAHTAELRGIGVGNAALVAIELESRALRAMVGSADFFDPLRPGQVNGAVARRSPGSALKPFLYALAFDRGLLVPGSLLLDVPTDYSGYIAENYDGRYRGLVTVQEALSYSLNAPAVRLLARLGVGDFLDLLRRGGAQSLDRAAAHYGLPLALGAGEVTLLELTNLYASMARGGRYRPVETTGEVPGPDVQWVSPEAAELVGRILQDVRRPDLPRSWRLAEGAPAVSWKTGTSYGHRDAWAVGYSRHFAIGVWTGNLDGRPRAGLSGAEHAAPLLFAALRALEPEGALLPRTPGLDIGSTEVCAVSRELPGAFCPARLRVETIRGRTALRPCSMHRRVFLDTETGDRLAGGCLGSRRHRSTTLEIFPTELLAWWRSEGREEAGLPALHSACRFAGVEGGPRIVSPAGDSPYRLRPGAPARFQKLQLRARAGTTTRELFWIQDGRTLATGRPDQVHFVPLTPGPHRLVVLDDAGRSDTVEYRVD